MSAEVQTPPAASKARFIKRPDDSHMKTEVSKLRKEIEKLDSSITEITNQIDKVSVDSASGSRKKELLDKLKELAGTQGTIKKERTQIMDQVKVLDNQVKKKISEIQAQTSKNSFKSVAEIDNKINALDRLVDSGDLKLAEERKTVKEMSALRKLRKDFGSVEKQQESIDQDKQKIADLKKKLNGIQNKEVQAEYEKAQKELNEINASNKSTYDKRGDLITKRNALRKQKDGKYDAIKKLRSEFNDQFTKFKTQMAEERKRRDEEYKAQQESEKASKKKALAEKQLQEASKPAFEDEINSIHSLLSYFDPTYVKPQPKKLGAESFTTSTNAIRTIEMPDDVVIIKKQQESFFEGSKGKKSKSKKTKAKNFTVDPEIIGSLSDLSISLPTKQDDVEGTVTTLKETLAALQDKQEEQTKINIEKAKAKIAELEAQESDAEEEDVADEAPVEN